MNKSEQEVGQAVSSALLAEAKRRSVVLDPSIAQAFGQAMAARRPEEALAAATGIRGRLGAEPWFRLVSFDADRIGEYVFASSRPPMVLGASRLLEQINDDLSRKPRAEAWPIYSAGGSGLLLQAHSADLEALRAEIDRTFAGSTAGALSVTTVGVPVTTQDLLPAASTGGFPRTMQRLAEQLRILKDQALPSDDYLPLPDDPLCDSCYQRAAVAEWSSPDRVMHLCEACEERRHVGQQHIRGTDFQSIASAATVGDRQWLALLALDGNGMGDILTRLDSLTQVRAFSEATTAVMNRVRDRAVDALGGEACISLLSGGDEIVLVVPAGGALQLAAKVIDEVEQGFRALQDDADLRAIFVAPQGLLHRLAATTVGVGLVLAPPKVPVRHLYRHAMALQRGAKEQCYYAQPSERCSGIDFACLVDGGALPQGPVDRRRDLLAVPGQQPVQRSTRPFSLVRYRELLEAARRLSGVPRSQVQMLRDRCEAGIQVAVNHLCYQVARSQQGRGTWAEWLQDSEINPRSRPEIVEWLFPRIDGRRGALFLDLAELSRWVGGPLS